MMNASTAHTHTHYPASIEPHLEPNGLPLPARLRKIKQTNVNKRNPITQNILNFHTLNYMKNNSEIKSTTTA